MSGFTIQDVRERTYKKRDAWWTVFLVDPMASRLTLWVANHTRITPNQLTMGALVLGMGAGACFAGGSYGWLALGALLYHLSFVLDCMDGKVARLKGSGSTFGSWLDYIFDRLRVLVCTLALMIGQFHATGSTVYLYLAFVVIFLDMLRYMDALQVYKLRHQMDRGIEREQERAHLIRVAAGLDDPDFERRQRERMAAEDDATEASLEEDDTAMPTQRGHAYAAAAPSGRSDDRSAGEDAVTVPAPAGPVDDGPDLQRGFRQRFPWYMAVRDRLRAWRVRPHLVSGIEFQMFVFIVGPLAGQIVTLTVAGGALLLVFELVIIYKLWLSTKDFERVHGDLVWRGDELAERLGVDEKQMSLPGGAEHGRFPAADSDGLLVSRSGPGHGGTDRSV